ncbi:MAG: hypothetical protein KF901_34545, partial [Myxococcales bacterium]|nr:hypothetical protein [Myxococcales bacterium]
MSDFESADSASVELSDSSILLESTSTSLPLEASAEGEAFSSADDDDDLGRIEPLAGEPTRARPPVLDGVSHDGDLFEAGLRQPAWETPSDLEAEPTQARATTDFDDETTKGQGAHGAGAQVRPSGTDLELTSPRQPVAGFPSDEVDTGLPPLEGEATLAKPLVDPNEAATHQRPAAPVVPPSGFAPSASPQPSGPHAAAPLGGHAPPAAVAGPTPSSTSAARPSAKSGETTAPVSAIGAAPGRTVRLGRWSLPLPVAVALLGVPVLVLVVVVAGVRWYLASQAEEAIAAAAEAASRDGVPASLRRALELDAEQSSESDAAIARRARLYAMAVLDHGFEETERTRALLGSLSDPAASTPDALVARTYLALEGARFDDAEQTALLLDATTLGGEAGHARALVALTRGELERAEVEARAVAERLPGAPRYVAQHARVLAALGRAPDAQERLGTIPNGERSPVVALARATAHLAAGAPEAALDALTSFESELVGASSARQRAHAARLRLIALVALGRSDEARTQLATVLPQRPAHDESFALDLVQAQVTLGDLDGAQALVAALPEAVAQRERRASVLAEVHLAAGDLAGVEAALRDMGESPRASYLRGRLTEAQGQLDVAKRHYQAAAEHASQRVAATSRLAAIALREGREAAVIELLEPLMPQARADAEVVSTLAQAYLASERAADAERVLSVALAERPDSTDLLLAKAEVDLARGETGAALAALEALLPRVETSPRAHATLGEAARREGRNARAAAAFARALELDPRQRVA